MQFRSIVSLVRGSCCLGVLWAGVLLNRPDKICHADEPRFSSDIAPLLQKRCVGCHGAKSAEAEYRLDTFERLLKDGVSGSPPIEPGKPESSELYLRLVTDDDDTRMPAESERLADEEIELVRRWIAAGAKFDGISQQESLSDLLPAIVHPSAPATYRRPIPISALAIDPSGQTVWLGGYHEITNWGWDGELQARIGDQGQRTYSIDFEPAGRRLLSASGTPGELGEVRLFEPETDLSPRVLVRADDVIMAARWSPDGTKVAVGMPNGALQVFDVTTGSLLNTLTGHSGAITALRWRDDGKQVVTASADRTAKVHDIEKGRSIATFSGHNGIVTDVLFSKDPSQLMSVAVDGSAALWSASDGRKRRDLLKADRPLFRIAASENAYILAGNRVIKRFESGSHRDLGLPIDSTDVMTAIDVHDAHVAIGTIAGDVLIVELETEKLQRFEPLPHE